MTTEPRRERLKTRILAAAERIVRDEGLAALQARRVAKAADCAIGTVYNVFGDIDDLIIAVNSRTLADLGGGLEAALARSAAGSLEVRLMALAGAYLDFAIANGRRWRAVFEHTLPEQKARPASFVADRTRLLALLEHQLATQLPDPAARTDAARALYASVHGIVQLSLDGRLGAVGPSDCERQIRLLVGLVLRGLEEVSRKRD